MDYVIQIGPMAMMSQPTTRFGLMTISSDKFVNWSAFLRHSGIVDPGWAFDRDVREMEAFLNKSVIDYRVWDRICARHPILAQLFRSTGFPGCRMITCHQSEKLIRGMELHKPAVLQRHQVLYWLRYWLNYFRKSKEPIYLHFN